MNSLIDAVVLTLNVLAFGLLVAAAANAFSRSQRRLAVWQDRAAWIPTFFGLLSGLIASGVVFVIYWVGYRMLGFPHWMRWLLGDF
jgi:hypothetical protein